MIIKERSVNRKEIIFWKKRIQEISNVNIPSGEVTDFEIQRQKKLSRQVKAHQ